MFRRKALYTGQEHPSDSLCEYGACYQQCSKTDYNSQNFYDYPEIEFESELKIHKIARKAYLKGFRMKNFETFANYCQQHPERITAEFLAGAADNQTLGSKNLVQIFRQADQLPARYNLLMLRLASHPYAGRVLTTIIAKQGLESARKILAERDDLTEEVQQILAFDKSKHVKYVLRNNPNIKEEYRVIASL